MVRLSLIVLLFVGLLGSSMSIFAVTQEVLPENFRAGNTPVVLVEQMGAQKKILGVTIEYTLSARTVLTRQMLMIQYRLQANDAFITLRTDIEPLDGESYITLLTKKTKLPQGSEKRYEYELNVLFNASRSGAMSLRIPALIYSEGGKDRFRFQFNEQAIDVTSLPPYLPPYTPMVPLTIESSFSQGWSWLNPLNTDEVYYWTINLQAEAADVYSLPDIRQQLHSDSTIQFLPAEVTRTTIKLYDKLLQKVSYSIPFIINNSTYASLPDLSIRYFNPQSRRLSSATYPLPGIVALNKYWYFAIIIVMAWLCLWLVWKIRLAVIAVFVYSRDYYRARRLVSQAESAVQLRYALNQLGLAWGWSGNLSLQQWGQSWRRDVCQTMDMVPAMDRLAYSLYGGGEDTDGVGRVRSILESSNYKQWILCCKAGLNSSRQVRG